MLQQVRLAKSVLGVPRVELDHVLDALVRSLINLKRLAADVPGDALCAGRSRQRPRVPFFL